MNYISKYNDNKATVCANKTCVTVYGDAARIVNAVAAAAAILAAIAFVEKALRKL